MKASYSFINGHYLFKCSFFIIIVEHFLNPLVEFRGSFYNPVQGICEILFMLNFGLKHVLSKIYIVIGINSRVFNDVETLKDLPRILSRQLD